MKTVSPDLSRLSYCSFKFNLLALELFSSCLILTVFEGCVLVISFISLLNHAKYFWPHFFFFSFFFPRDNTHLIQVFPVISSRNLFIADTKAGNAAHHLAWWMIFLSSAANQWGVSQTGGRKVSILVQFSGEVPNKYNWKIPVTCIAAPAEQWSCWPEKGCYPDEDHSHCHTAVADTVSCNEMV